MPTKCIVLIEDEIILARMLSEALRSVGYTVWVAGNGNEGIALVTEKNPDLVLLNILLPDMDGLEILKRIKENPATKHIRVVMVTVLDIAGRMAKAAELGAYSYIVKSEQDLNELVRRIQENLP